MADWDAFTRGFHGGASMVQSYNEASKKDELAKVGRETESKVFTAQQGEELEAIANAKDANGNPYYQVGANEDGTYSVTPNFKDETGDSPQEYKPASIAAKGVSFLGKNFDEPLTDQQRNSARAAAMAGVYEKHGDVEGAARVRSLAKQDYAADLNIRQAESQERQTKRAEDLQAKADTVNHDVAGYTEKFSKNPDGTDRELSYDDHLHLGQYKAARLMSAGLVDEASKLAGQNMQFTANKIQVETAKRDQALGLATAAASNGDLNGIKDFYNKYIPDGAQTTNIVAGKDGKVTVSRVGVDGEALAPHVFKDVHEMIASAQSISKPEALYNYANNEFHRTLQQQQLKLSQQQVGIQGAQLKLSQDARAREVKKEEDFKNAGVGLFREAHPAATNNQLEAVRTGVMPAIQGKGAYKVESNDVTTLLGAPAVDSKGVPITDPLSGRQLVNRDPAKEAEFFKFMKDNGITDTNAGLAQFLGQKSDAQGPKPKDANDAAEQARAAAKAGIPLTAINAQLKAWGYPPIN